MIKNHLRRVCALAVCAVGLLAATAAGSRAQSTDNIVLFPAYLGADATSESARSTQKIVTDALRTAFIKVGVGVVVYRKNLPSVQRAVQESERGIKEEDATKGPGDDGRKARALAEVIGAAEYITVFVDDYKYDPATRTASFNLSLSRYASGSDAAIASIANPQRGEAPVDVAPARQEGSAVARAAVVGAEQAVAALFPQATMARDAKPAKPRKTTLERLALPIFVGAIGVLYFSTR
jgi:hypothetical protein